MKKIKVDEKGYQNLLRKITEAELELHILRYHSGKNIVRTKKWYDDPDNYGQHLKEQMIQKRINMLREQINNCEIIEKSYNESLVDLDDIVKLNITSFDENEEMLIKLVGGIGNNNTTPLEISINSPLGNSIYQKNIGENTSYDINNEHYAVSILEKCN